jgi:ABC-2 type transport system ATP-binding protein
MFVQTENLTKRFGDFTALNAVSLEIPAGEVFGLLGPNGAGKSTLIRTLLGFLNASSGRASIAGLDCQKERVEVHRKTTYLPGDARMYSMMRARRVLALHCGFRATASYEKGLEIADRLELDLNRWVGLMSTGMRQKLALAATLAADVPLIILDEPTANLDPTVRGEVLKMVQEAKSRGKTIIFSSHVLSEIEDTCDRVGILRSGELVHVELMTQLKRQHRIRGKLTGAIPDLPEHLNDSVAVKVDQERLQVETAGELSSVLGWLSEVPLSDVYVMPVGLRSVYDRFHFPDSVPVQSEPVE